MFLLDFMRYTRGHVRFSANGAFVERFLNLVARDHIPVWDSRKHGGEYTGRVNASDYRRLRSHAKKAGVRLHITEKNGAPFIRRKYRRRWGLPLGLAFFFAFLFVMSTFIWRIEVNGNIDVPESRIVQALDELGIHPGTFRPSIDVRQSERRAMLSMPELSWVALNIDGSTLHVEVTERVPTPAVVNPKAPCNVVAGESGQIIYMNVFDGQPLKAAGDSVMQGDIIISGIMQDRLGQNLFRHARAQIIARVERDVTVEVPFEQTKFVPSGDVKKRGYLDLFGLELPFFLPFKIPHPYHVQRERENLSLFSLTLPITYLREEYVLMEEVPVTLTKKEAKSMALNQLDAIRKVELDGAEILEQTVSDRVTPTHFIIDARFIANVDIALEKEIILNK